VEKLDEKRKGETRARVVADKKKMKQAETAMLVKQRGGTARTLKWMRKIDLSRTGGKKTTGNNMCASQDVEKWKVKNVLPL